MYPINLSNFMASITVRNLDDELKQRLRVRAAQHTVLMNGHLFGAMWIQFDRSVICGIRNQ